MSDKSPPTMHINELCDDAVLLIFSQLPFKAKLEVLLVSDRWRSLQEFLFRFEERLALTIGRSREYEVNDASAATVVDLFPDISELEIVSLDEEDFDVVSPQVKRLLDHYSTNLKNFKFTSEISEWVENSNLFDGINSLTELEALSLNFAFTFCNLNTLEWSFLRQVNKFDLHCRDLSLSIIKQWTPHLEERSTEKPPLLIQLSGDPIIESNMIAFYSSISASVAAMFTTFPKFYCDLNQFQELAPRFHNLTELSLDDTNAPTVPYSSDVPALMRALVNLKQLTSLSIVGRFVDHLNVQPSGNLPELPTVKKWYLKLEAPGDGRINQYKHNRLSSWTTNLGHLFPNLEDFSLSINLYGGCADCGYKARIDQYNATAFSFKSSQATVCLRRQLRPIKQQCSTLRRLNASFDEMHTGIENDCLDAKCTLDDIASN